MSGDLRGKDELINLLLKEGKGIPITENLRALKKGEEPGKEAA